MWLQSIQETLGLFFYMLERKRSVLRHLESRSEKSDLEVVWTTTDRILLVVGTQRMWERAWLCGRGAIGFFLGHMQKTSTVSDFPGTDALFISEQSGHSFWFRCLFWRFAYLFPPIRFGVRIRGDASKPIILERRSLMRLREAGSHQPGGLIGCIYRKKILDLRWIWNCKTLVKLVYLHFNERASKCPQQSTNHQLRYSCLLEDWPLKSQW